MSNLAEKYDFSLFENYGNTVPKTDEPKSVPKITRIKKPKQETQPKPRIKRNWAKILAGTAAFVTITGIAGLRIEKEVEMTMLTDQINTTQQLLAEAKATETQLTLQMDQKINSLDLEHYAKTVLGMQPIQQSQVTYIERITQDKGTIHQPVKEPTLIDNIKQKIQDLLD